MALRKASRQVGVHVVYFILFRYTGIFLRVPRHVVEAACVGKSHAVHGKVLFPETGLAHDSTMPDGTKTSQIKIHWNSSGIVGTVILPVAGITVGTVQVRAVLRAVLFHRHVFPFLSSLCCPLSPPLEISFHCADVPRGRQHSGGSHSRGQGPVLG